MKLSLKIDAPDYGPTASMRQDRKWRGDLSRELRLLADRLGTLPVPEPASSVMLVDDPFPRELYTPLFLLRLYYHDLHLEVARVTVEEFSRRGTGDRLVLRYDGRRWRALAWDTAR